MTYYTNRQISILLNVSEKTIFNKRNGLSPWYLTEYLLLVKNYGKDDADEIVGVSKLINDMNKED